MPADTPYVLAVLEPWPDDYIDLYFSENRPALARALETLRALPPGSREMAKVPIALLEEIEPRFSRAGMRELGLAPFPRLAIFGVGLMPAARVELVDPAAFRAFLERVVAKSGAQAIRGEERGRPSWRFQLPGGKATAVVMLEGAELVVTVAPTALLDRHLARLFAGGQSIASAGTLDRVARDHHLARGMLGVIDVGRVLAGLEADRDVILALGGELPAFPPPCRDELAALAATMPRWIMGLEAFAPGSARGTLTVELRPELARALMAARTAVPGVGAPLGEDIVAMAVALDLPAAMDALRDEAERVARTPRRCAALAPVTQAARELARELGGPPALWASLRGFAATLRSASTTLGIQQIKAYGLVAAVDPIRLLELARNAFPGLAGLSVPEDGTPVPLPSGLVPFLPEAHIAMRGQLLGLSLGAGMQPALVKLMAAPPHAGRAILSLSYDQARLREVVTSLAGAEAARDFEGHGSISMLVEAGERGLTFRAERRYGR